MWLPITWHIFKRYPVPRAATLCFISGMLVLPNYVEIKLPLMPGVGKFHMINLGILIALWRQRPPGQNRRIERWWYVAAIGTFVSGYLSGHTNPDPMFYTRTVVPGHTFKDSMFIAMSTLLGGMSASYLGMRCYRGPQDLHHLLKPIVWLGLLYCIPIAWELRFSPQLHLKVYGYASPHEWGQLLRYGGYRPLVMFSHGLVLSLFMLTPTISATALARLGERVGSFTGRTAMWILTVMVGLCKSTGVWLYALIALPMVRFASYKAMTRLASVLVVLTCLYPWLRANEYIPVNDLLAFVGKYNEERAQSLQVRFDNEDILLAKAMLRPWFGWGSYGRNRVLDEEGVDICITDGAWIITLGCNGFIGGAFYYMFNVFPVLIAARRLPRIRDPQLRNALAAIALLCGITWFDNLPNAPGFYVSEFLGGALCSITFGALRDQRLQGKQAPPQGARKREPVQPAMQAR